MGVNPDGAVEARLEKRADDVLVVLPDNKVERMKLVAKGAGVTVNDVLLAMSAGALRDYLLERDALPSAPLVAMTPVSLRQESDFQAPVR